MIWNEHSKLRGQHALFSASTYNWINKDMDEIIDSYCSSYATSIGTILHEYCADRIKFSEKVQKSNRRDVAFELLRNNIPPVVVDNVEIDRIFPILQAYVNDSIGFHMIPEQPLYYSDRFFGTADAIAFKDKKLRIHDFKSGKTPAHIEQLFIYAAYFCLEYDMHPTDLDIELRIYQAPEVLVMQPTASDIVPIMDKAVTVNKYFERLEG